MTSLAGIFAFVFSLTIVLSMAVYAGEGGGPPLWCYWGNPYDPYDLYTETIEGQCCIYDGVRGQWEDINPEPSLKDWICNCTGLYEGPLIWNPCDCSFSCGGWPD